MSKPRKPVGDRIRFEVFKRDNFKCQYCGATAPEAVLQVDHITSVAGGGENDLLNLITSCRQCNGGKGARPLLDRSAIEKQREQLEELNERRRQLEMLLEWRNELAGLRQMTAEVLIKKIHELAPEWEVTADGRASVNRWLKDHTVVELLDAAETSAHHYLRRNQDGQITEDSWAEFFNKIPRIAAIAKDAVKEPYLRDLFYVRAVLKNMVERQYRGRLPWWFFKQCMPLLKAAVAAGLYTDELKDLARRAENWQQFFNTVNRWIDEAER